MGNDNHWVDEHLAVLSPGKNWAADINRGLAQLRDRRTTRARAWTWSAAIATASLCLMAFPAPRAAAQYCLTCSVALWQTLATSASTRASVTPENARKPAPDFILNDAFGRHVRLS